MSLQRPSLTSIYVLPACQSPLALVIRRGPSKWWHFLLWNRDTGDVQAGSWFNGLVFPSRCDLSPKGDWMVLIAYRGHQEPHAWTALCKPPSVKAMVFWPQEHAKIGGGFFDPRLPVAWLNLPEGTTPAEIRAKQPYDFGYLEADGSQVTYGSVKERMVRDGWKECTGAVDSQERALVGWVKTSKRNSVELYAEYLGQPEEIETDPSLFLEGERVSFRYRLGRNSSDILMKEVTWANINSHGDICFVKDGCLYSAVPSEQLEPTLVLDLNGMQPRVSTSSAASDSSIPRIQT